MKNKNNLQYIEELMNLTLPGIDINDLKKTLCTLKFYAAIFICIPIYDSNDDPNGKDFFSEWCLQFLNNILELLSNTLQQKNETSNDLISPSLVSVIIS